MTFNVRRTVHALALAIVLVLLGSLPGVAQAPTTPTTRTPQTDVQAVQKIKPHLREQLAEQDSVDLWVRFADHVNLARPASSYNWAARGRSVVSNLQTTARSSQADVKALLDAQGVDYQSFWATNAIKVTGASPALADELAAQPEVGSLWPSFRVEAPRTTVSHARQSIADVEWGISQIHADQAWERYNVRGEGITVATIDTGVQYDHPALVDQYRGNNGDGTFTHDYNWYDVAGSCPGSPCDNDGHGTHTMGTIAGSDGGANQIGVAPKVQWIAANGCCPSDAALVASAEWMLAPTDMEGNNPDPSKRPQIVSNSWGTTEPTNEPFLEDLSAAWTAAGIFGIWANGNIGPGCETSGAPGSRTINYSVGAYDENGEVASFSSRGAGQDGEIKPNISAPGVNIRSASPDGGYVTMNGTSMATPHVAGAIALLWSAAPALQGDIASTEALLDDTAVDHADDQCGGTAGDNNVYGEGELDVLALLQQAPIGPNGRTTGTVTSSETGQPIADATVTITGSVHRRLRTAADGTYASGALPVGSYTVTATKYGFTTESTTAEVADGETTTADVALGSVPQATVSGTVTDGSGHGWPLYAKLTIEGYPGAPIFTDPVTGKYSIDLVQGRSYTLHVDTQYDGYQRAAKSFDLGASDLSVNPAVRVDATTCAAAGYRWNGTSQTFNSWWAAKVRSGWQARGRKADRWRYDNPRHHAPPAGGGGRLAVADATGARHELTTSLTSPTLNLSNQRAPRLSFDSAYYGRGVAQRGVVQLSTNAGKTWKTVWKRGRTNALSPVNIALKGAGHHKRVQVRFTFTGKRAHWWAIDDVFIGTRSCVPVKGGLVVGYMNDKDTGEPVFGTVARKDAPQAETTPVRTPADASAADGLYWLFVPATASKTTGLLASAPGYQRATASVRTPRDVVVTRNWALTPATL